MAYTHSIVVLSDIHYAEAEEKTRGSLELSLIKNPILKLFTKAYRHFIWRRDPFAHNHLLDSFLDEAPYGDYVVANGDYSCDTAFIGVSDEASFKSAQTCLTKLRRRFGNKLLTTIGDHELGKMSLFSDRGGMRLDSWHRTVTGLGLAPFWTIAIGKTVLIGMTSSLVAFPVLEPETLPHERAAWQQLRKEHLSSLEHCFSNLSPDQRVILFCHDPTALPFLWQAPGIRAKIDQLEMTVIGHLHSSFFLMNSLLLSGLPTISFFGSAVRRMSAALQEARYWKHFKVKLCPSLGGIELLKDGGYCRIDIDPTATHPSKLFRYRIK